MKNEVPYWLVKSDSLRSFLKLCGFRKKEKNVYLLRWIFSPSLNNKEEKKEITYCGFEISI